MVDKLLPTDANKVLANDLYVAATLGTYIHNEDSKADSVLTKDGQQAENHIREADQLALVTLKMPYGDDRIYKQTDIMMDAKTGVKVMMFERRNADHSTFLGPDGKPQVVIENVGNIGTNEDIAAFSKLVHGEDNPALFQAASAYTEKWIGERQKLASASGVPMPNILLAGHSMGNYTIGAITLALHDHNLDPTRTIEIEPVGAGSGLRYLAQRNNATPTQAETTANLLAQKVSSFRAPTTIFHYPGGGTAHANSMVGDTYEYAGAPGLLAAITNHTLVLPANDMLKYGVDGIKRTPEHDTPISAFLHDTPLPWYEKVVANRGVGNFTTYTKITRGNDEYGDIKTAPTDLHLPDSGSVNAFTQSPSNNGHVPKNYASMKIPVHTELTAAAQNHAPAAQTNGKAATTKNTHPTKSAAMLLGSTI